MRTNIELDDDLISEASRYSSAATKRALVREALVTFIAVKAEAQRRATYSERLERVRARATGVRLSADTRDLVRRDRDAR